VVRLKGQVGSKFNYDGNETTATSDEETHERIGSIFGRPWRKPRYKKTPR